MTTRIFVIPVLLFFGALFLLNKHTDGQVYADAVEAKAKITGLFYAEDTYGEPM